MKIVKVVLVLVLISSAIAAQVQPVQYLIDSAASDFHAHGPSKTLHFRNVRLGQVQYSDGTQYMLCGQFTAGPTWRSSCEYVQALIDHLGHREGLVILVAEPLRFAALIPGVNGHRVLDLCI
jgi:hypothetical protein